MLITEREEVTKQCFCKILWRKPPSSGKSLIRTRRLSWVGWGWALIWVWLGGGGGRRLLTFSALRMGAYSRWAVIRGWALITINTVFISLAVPFKSLRCCLRSDKLLNCHMFENSIESFHMTSRRPFWCPKTMKRRPCWCSKPILWELNSFLMQTLSFVPKHLHKCWAREWKHSIGSATRARRPSTSLHNNLYGKKNLSFP